MGVYDYLEVDPSIHLPGFTPPSAGTDPSEIEWQTKSIGMPHMGRYRLTAAGELLMEESHSESVPKEERPLYNEEIDGFEHEFEASAGMFRTIHDGWSKRKYHGTFEFSAIVNDTHLRYEATFTHGQLESLRRTDENGPDRAASATRLEVLTWTETRTENPLIEETVIEGYLAGDHDESVLVPDERMPNDDEITENGYSLWNLIPPAAHSGTHRFRVTVEATPVADARDKTEGDDDRRDDDDRTDAKRDW